MNLLKKSIKSLNPSPYNPRQISEESLSGLSASIKKFGIVEPIIWNQKSGNVVGGHQRLKVLQSEGVAETEVIVVDLDETDEKALNVALNNKYIQGDWDYPKLQILLDELKIDLPEFEDLRLDSLEIELSENIEEPEIIEDDAPEADDSPLITKKGDLWILGDHRLLCGDSTNKEDVALLLGDKKPILMVTDPPYGVKYDPNWREVALDQFGESQTGLVENDSRIDWSEAYSLFNSQIAYVWHAGRHAKHVQENLESVGYEIISQIIWNKQHLVLSRGDYHWKHEPCWYAVRKGENHNWQGDRSQTTVWDIQNNNPVAHKGQKEEKFGHGTQKPIECMARPIRNNSSKGDLICDPFLGSGTTLIACEQLDRICFGMEISAKYCDVIIKRWEKLTGKKAIRSEEA